MFVARGPILLIACGLQGRAWPTVQKAGRCFKMNVVSEFAKCFGYGECSACREVNQAGMTEFNCADINMRAMTAGMTVM